MTIYIDPGSQNGDAESFHGRLRDECFNREQFWILTETRVVIEDYRREYNSFRPHSKPGYLSRNASPRGRAHSLRLAYGLPTPEVDNPTTTN